MEEKMIKTLLKYHNEALKHYDDQLSELRENMSHHVMEIQSLEKQLKLKQSKDLFTNCGEDADK